MGVLGRSAVLLSGKSPSTLPMSLLWRFVHGACASVHGHEQAVSCVSVRPFLRDASQSVCLSSEQFPAPPDPIPRKGILLYTSQAVEKLREFGSLSEKEAAYSVTWFGAWQALQNLYTPVGNS